MIILGDSNDELKKLEDNSIDALVTDPPYGLSNISHSSFMDCLSKWSSGEYGYTPNSKGFMSKSWDGFVPPPSIWKEVYRVLKPGSHGLVFAGSRTMDLMGLSLRIAGFEIRDCISWLYRSGFPKSHDVSKAIDKLKGEEREIIGESKRHGGGSSHIFIERGNTPITAPSSEEAKQWEGFGTALKPAYEPALLIRKPFKSSVAQNVLEHGTGALNIDGCRIESDTSLARVNKIDKGMFTIGNGRSNQQKRIDQGLEEQGRFPSNVIMNEEASNLLQGQSRFFYTAKSSQAERSAGLDGMNIHPTVKPIEIMRYLCRLITPPNGVVLDCFLGSGTTAIAAEKEHFKFIGIEREEEYYQIALKRIQYWKNHNHAMTKQNPPDESQLELFK